MQNPGRQARNAASIMNIARQPGRLLLKIALGNVLTNIIVTHSAADRTVPVRTKPPPER
jgi:hypothetical protein